MKTHIPPDKSDSLNQQNRTIKYIKYIFMSKIVPKHINKICMNHSRTNKIIIIYQSKQQQKLCA